MLTAHSDIWIHGSFCCYENRCIHITKHSCFNQIIFQIRIRKAVCCICREAREFWYNNYLAERSLAKEIWQNADDSLPSGGSQLAGCQKFPLPSVRSNPPLSVVLMLLKYTSQQKEMDPERLASWSYSSTLDVQK